MLSTNIYHPNFIQNKYFDLYKRLIEVDLSDAYMETHHILPRCLGGTNDSSNLKPITSRIHFLAHYLLTKFVEKDTSSWHKVVNAFNFMKASPGNKRYVNSRLYEANRKHMSLLRSGSLNSNFGTMWITDGTINKRINKDVVIADGWFKGRTIVLSEEAKEKLRLAKIGKTFSEETKSKLSLASKNSMYITNGTINKRIKKDVAIPEGWVKGRTIVVSEETKKKMRLAKIGKTFSEETKEKMSLSKKNIMYITDGTINKRINKDVVIADGWFKGRTKVHSEQAACSGGACEVK